MDIDTKIDIEIDKGIDIDMHLVVFQNPRPVHKKLLGSSVVPITRTV